MTLIDLIKVIDDGQQLLVHRQSTQIFYGELDRDNITIPVEDLDRIVSEVRYTQLYNAIWIVVE